jgi:hypothetical protein
MDFAHRVYVLRWLFLLPISGTRNETIAGAKNFGHRKIEEKRIMEKKAVKKEKGKLILLNFKATEKQRDALQKKANKFTDGNISMFLRKIATTPIKKLA